jgi:hypothetical protein
MWSYRYTRLAERISDSTRRPSVLLMQKAAWIGVASSALSIVFSMLVILFEVAQLLIYFLRAPQAGVPVIRTTGGGQASWVSAADIMHLMALVVTTFGEFTVLAFAFGCYSVRRAHPRNILAPVAMNEIALRELLQALGERSFCVQLATFGTVIGWRF